MKNVSSIKLVLIVLCLNQRVAFAQWTLQNTSIASVALVSFESVDTSVAWGLGFALNRIINQFERTTNGGALWSQGSITDADGLTNGFITAIDGKTAWVTMQDISRSTSGGVFKTTDGGTTWAKQTTAFPGSGGFPMFIHFFSADTGLVVGDRDRSNWEIYTTTNGGTTWILDSSANIPQRMSGDGFSQPPRYTWFRNTFWFGTDIGRVYKSTDRGHNWTVAPIAQKEVVAHSLAFQDDSIGLATAYAVSGGLNGGFHPTTFKTTTGGRTWFPIDPPLVPRPHIITHVPGTGGIYVVTGHMLGGDIIGSAYTLNGGLSWTTVDSTSYATPVFAAPNIGWAAAGGLSLNGGGVYRWSGTVLATPTTARILATRSAIDLGSVESGKGLSSDTSIVYLCNIGALPLSILNIFHSNNSYQLFNVPTSPTIVQPDGAVQLKIVFKPVDQGIVKDTIVITSNDPLSPVSRVALQAETFSITKAQAGVLYGTTGGADSTRLCSVNFTNGIATSIGPTVYSPIISMAVHPITKEIIGLLPNGGGGSNLVRINAASGDAHPLPAINPVNPKGLAFRPDGLLYVGTFNARVYAIDMATGAEVQNVLTNPPIRIAGLAISPRSGGLWASVRTSSGPSDGIYEINLSTGATTLVGFTGFGGMTLDILFSKGKLYGLTDSTATVKNSLIQIDTTTGVGTLIGATGLSSMQALAAMPDSPAVLLHVLDSRTPPMSFVLEQNYPNPFNPTTVISYQLPVNSHITLTIYDLLGREVTTLVDEQKTAGIFEARFDASKLSSGVYFYRLKAGSYTETKKLMLVK